MQTIQNDSDLQLLYAPLSLYLKPLANLTISINLPSNVTGKTISNFDVMDKLRQMILPDTFSLLKVIKFIQFLKRQLLTNGTLTILGVKDQSRDTAI